MDSSALYSDEYRRNPEIVWKEMLNDFPVFYDDISDIWWLTRYADVKNFFDDYQTFSSSTYELTTGQVVGPTLISRDDYGHVVRVNIHVCSGYMGLDFHESVRFEFSVWHIDTLGLVMMMISH